MKLSRSITFISILDINGKVLPVGFNQVRAKHIVVGSLPGIALGLVPAGLVGVSVVGDEALGHVVLGWGVSGWVCVGHGAVGNLGLVVGDPHVHTEVNMGILIILGLLKQVNKCLEYRKLE